MNCMFSSNHDDYSVPTSCLSLIYWPFFSFNRNLSCCPPGFGKREEEDILEKAMNYTNIPKSLANAPDYVKELVQRTGKLLHN